DLVLFKGSVRVTGRSSPDALYSSALVSFDTMGIDQCHAIGVSQFYGLQGRLLEQMKKEKERK
ncbi:MAG: argininosuccinate synthase, partial [Methanomicrobiales archaeon]|nr:argininosuccinate synthase [Methanomicrobiales archaeon]